MDGSLLTARFRTRLLVAARIDLGLGSWRGERDERVTTEIRKLNMCPSLLHPIMTVVFFSVSQKRKEKN